MSGKRWLVVPGLLLVLALGAASVALLLPKWVRARVLATADAAGVTLAPQGISFGLGWVRLTQTRVTLQHVHSVTMQVERIDVTLNGLTPSAIELSNIDGQVQGSLASVGLELSDWTKAHPAAYALPLTATNAHVAFAEQAGGSPWLDVTGGALTRTLTGGVFTATHAHFLGVDLGTVGAGFSRENSAIALGFGETDLARAPLRVEVTYAPVPSAKFSLAPTSADRLTQPLGIPLPVHGVTVSAETTLTFSGAENAETIQGRTSITLKGYVPPHPVELNGFLFGDTTSFDSKFTMPPARDRLTLSETQLKAGAFELRGNGLVVRTADHAEVHLTLNGQLPCSALASVTAGSRVTQLLGKAMGAKAAELAGTLLNGSVAIGLEVSVDTRHLAAAKLQRTIGVGCGLQPLSLAELQKLVPLPTDALSVLKDLPALPLDLSSLGVPGLPSLPSGLPPFPSAQPSLPRGLPALPLPQLGRPGLKPAPQPSKAVPNAPSTSRSKPTAKPLASSGS